MSIKEKKWRKFCAAQRGHKRFIRSVKRQKKIQVSQLLNTVK